MSFQDDIECIFKNRLKYIDEWLAIKDGKLIGHDKSREKLSKYLSELNLLEDALFYDPREWFNLFHK